MVFSDNIARTRIGVFTVSRGNFHPGLSRSAMQELEKELSVSEEEIYFGKEMIDTEVSVKRCLQEAEKNQCNAAVVILGNFGPEGPETIFAKKFWGPVMYLAVSENSIDSFYDGRRDSYCGLLNCSYNLELRNCYAYIPDDPIGNPAELAERIKEFIPIARTVVSLKHLKIISFGPRPKDFFACNAPISGLYDMDIEIEENSEMDLYLSYLNHKNDPRIPDVVEDMKRELGHTKYTELLPDLAQYELTLLDWREEHKGICEYVAFANKCWPAFQEIFHFLPCYVHSRLCARGIPVGCEVDIYGTLSQYIGICLTNNPAALLDINNNFPGSMEKELQELVPGSEGTDFFMGFHCGNTPSCLMEKAVLKYKLNRKAPYTPETGKELNRGTLEGALKSGKVTLFRVHADKRGKLQAYMMEGDILSYPIQTYGCYAVFCVKNMKNIYRKILIERNFPHHGAVAYGNIGKQLTEVLKFLGIENCVV